MDAELKGMITKIFQASLDTYTDFLGKLIDAIRRQVRSKEIKQLLTKLLVFEYVNEDCQAIICPIREKDVIGFLQASRNIILFSFRVSINSRETP